MILTAVLWIACYATGAVGVWLKGPLEFRDYTIQRPLTNAERVGACLVWPITLLQMWDPK